MPLVKKQSGWFWGSKGPFDTRAKALAVSRAAYAHGYKGEATEVIAFDLSESKDKSVDMTEKFKQAAHNLS